MDAAKAFGDELAAVVNAALIEIGTDFLGEPWPSHGSEDTERQGRGR
jgi:hypothetical protein